MKSLSYRLYVNFENAVDSDSLCVDEISDIEAEYSTLDDAKKAIKENTYKIKSLKPFNDLQVVSISIVEVLDTNYDIETEEIAKYPISEV